MNILKTAALVLLSLVLAVSLTVALFASSVQILLYPEVYERALENGGVYGEINRQMHNFSSQLPITMDPGPFIKNLLRDLLGNLLAYLRSDTDSLNLTISAATIKTFLVTQMNNVTVCAENQIQFTGGNITCRPPGVEPSHVVEQLLVNQTLPSIDIAQVINEGNGLAKIRDMIALFRNALNMVLLLVLAALFLIVCLTRHSVKSLLRWVGANMVIVGIIALASLAIQENLLGLIPQGEVPDVVVSVAVELLTAVFDRIALYGGVLLGAGVVMIVFSFLVSKISKK